MNKGSSKQISDPLEQLFRDNTAIQMEERGKLATLLGPYVILSKKESIGLMNFKPEFFKLSNIDKLEICFLAEKARATYLADLENEGLGQTNIINLKIMPQGSVKSGMSRFLKEKRVIPSSKSKYLIPNYRLPEIFEKYSSIGRNKNEQ